MTKHYHSFYDFDEVISHFNKNVNFDIEDVFKLYRINNPMMQWCAYHNINPYRTKTILVHEIIEQWRIAEDRENYYPPYVNYLAEINNLITDTNKFGIGFINLNTFKESIYANIKISDWSCYWTKYEKYIYSLNERFVSLFIPFSEYGILTVFNASYFDEK